MQWSRCWSHLWEGWLWGAGLRSIIPTPSGYLFVYIIRVRYGSGATADTVKVLSIDKQGFEAFSYTLGVNTQLNVDLVGGAQTYFELQRRYPHSPGSTYNTAVLLRSLKDGKPISLLSLSFQASHITSLIIPQRTFSLFPTPGNLWLIPCPARFYGRKSFPQTYPVRQSLIATATV